MSLTTDLFSRSIISITIPIDNLKFVYSVPQVVDSDLLIYQLAYQNKGPNQKIK
ncbi:unnamed protein product [Paramecium sonneborni]|uniref:Uncharacterized protein n=1 Tax=Paramecium sonneborni TaxID=65129 RepID=A0A8S1RHQ0_9CILI|nr:unnamed protein product [Paramecium sonneborni]